MEPPLVLKYQKIHPRAKSPKRATTHSVGYDLCAINPVNIQAKARRTIPLGLIVQVPEGHYGRLAPKSGIAEQYGISVMGGVIDPDYRGELKTILINLGRKDYISEPGTQIVQLILEKASIAELQEVEELSQTVRGTRGFGSFSGEVSRRQAQTSKESSSHGDEDTV